MDQGCRTMRPKMAASLNPKPDQASGSPLHPDYMEELALTCASAFLQCAPFHPLHERYQRAAGGNRIRLTRLRWNEHMHLLRTTGPAEQLAA